jgi:uncharacterized membrane protein YccC
MITPRVGSAIRFAITILVADLIGVGLFKVQGAATYTSFAVVCSLYFLDFDGSWRERLGGYASATAVGLVGVLVGTSVASTVWIAAIAALVIGFAFAFARVLRGYVARSAVGVQMAFLLAVLSPAESSDLGWYLLAWLTGSAIAAIAALILFPHRHNGQLRTALSGWCQAARNLALATTTSRARADVDALERSCDDLDRQWEGTVIRPGLVSRRMRALMQMRLEAVRSTRSLADLIDSRQPLEVAGPLSEVTADGLRVAATMVAVGGASEPLVPVGRARQLDAERSEQWTAAAVRTSGSAAVDALARHNAVRVLSISADVMQNLAATSAGGTCVADQLGLPLERSLTEQLRANLSPRSYWLRNAVRSAVAVSAAIVIARLLGLQHGIWVAVSALSVIQVTFTSGGSSRSALRTAVGSAVGIATAGLIIWVFPQWWILAILLPLAAFFAKWAAIGLPLLGQFAYSPFCVINVAVLSWPEPIHLVDVRFQDVCVGMLVALLATLLTFPHGLGRLLAAGWATAYAAAQSSLRAATSLLTDARLAESDAADAEHRLARATTTFMDTVDAAFMSTRVSSSAVTSLSAQEAWLFEALLVSAIFREFTQADGRPADVRQLAEALCSPTERLAAVRLAAERDAAALERAPRALVSATWAAWWLDHLADTDPQEHQG